METAHFMRETENGGILRFTLNLM